MVGPFAALDAQNRALQKEAFLSLWSAQGATVIFVTHDLAEAILLGDRVMLMSHRPGRVVADVPIDIPRPKPAEAQFENARFLEYRSQLTGLLRTK
ncbi:putative ABC transporter ATP-binding protein (fragment) [Blastococcus saxobsidens DD2]|uniref:Putative ABC transporter ATP-binding protein n=1 Tax=Blastococcus saxobsidens (strain DD2) TaxID=1146883 RepID=H6RNR8_BLASD